MKTRTTSNLATITIAFAIIWGGLMTHAADSSIQERISTAQETGSVTNLLELSKEIEALWPQKPQDYFQQQNLLGEALQPLCTTNDIAKQLLEQQADLALSKKCPDDAVIIESCFSAKEAIVERVAKVTESTASLHMAQLIANTLGEAQAAISTNYESFEVSANVAPPNTLRQKQVVTDGVDPNLINDPVARDAYKEAIAENELKRAKNIFQGHLSRMIWNMKPCFAQYCHELFEINPDTKKLADALARAAHLTKSETDQLKGHSN
jgi:hypothetical protein